MRISKIALENFCGVQSLTVNLNGKSADIMAASGAGKTALANALPWLVCGCSYDECSEFYPITLGKQTNYQWGKVDVTFILPSGVEVSLGKAYYESAFAYNVYYDVVDNACGCYYFINGEKTSKASFEELLLEITGCTRDELSLLFVNEYIWNMDYAKRRNQVLEFVPSVTDKEILGRDGRLEMLVTILKENDMDVVAYSNLARARRMALKDEITNLPKHLRDMVDELPDFKQESVEDVEKEIKEYEENISLLEQQRQHIDESYDVKECLKKIHSLKIKIGKAEKAYCFHAIESNKPKENIIRELLLREGEHIAVVHRLRASIKTLKRQYNDDKSNECVKNALNDKLLELREAVRNQKNCHNDIEALKMSCEIVPDYSLTEEFAVLKGRIDVYEARKAIAIEAEEQRINQLVEMNHKAIEDAKQRKGVLMQGERLLGILNQEVEHYLECHAEYENLTYLIDMCRLYALCKARLLNERMAEIFPTLRFVFYEMLANGTMIEKCSPTVCVNGEFVPFAIASRSEVQNAKLEMAEALRLFYNKDIPIVVDDYLSADGCIKPSEQFIRMIYDNRYTNITVDKKD